jgi:hypothetical protein
MKTLTLILLTFFGFSCHVPTSDAQILNTLIVKAEGPQLDKMMTIWFNEFMENQNNGENMMSADQSAVKVVVYSFSKDNTL